MFKLFRAWMTKVLYNLLIYKTIVLDKTRVANYEKMATFCELDVRTDKGVFKFIFKEDVRRSIRKERKFPSVNNYIIELLIPSHLSPVDTTVTEKVVMVVKVVLYKPDYEVLTQLLIERYLDSILLHIQNRDHS